MLRYIFLLIIIVAAVILFPLYPEVQFQSVSAREVFLGKVLVVETADNKGLPQENWLKIDSIKVNVAIIEGADEKALDRGVWRRPHTSTPDQLGNTVLTGHRFLYTGFAKNTFYNLDKVKIGDLIEVFWKGEQYKYKVDDIKIVMPTSVEIEDDYGDTRLTLYTCHPLWTADKRLVVVAKPL